MSGEPKEIDSNKGKRDIVAKAFKRETKKVFFFLIKEYVLFVLMPINL